MYFWATGRNALISNPGYLSILSMVLVTSSDVLKDWFAEPSEQVSEAVGRGTWGALPVLAVFSCPRPQYARTRIEGLHGNIV